MADLLSDDWSTGATLLFGLLTVVLWPATVLVHELGHALVARRYGVAIEELVVAPEGRTIRFTIAGTPVRLGLGLKREHTSTEFEGWVRFRPGYLSSRAVARILWAGPLAHGTFSTLLVLTGLLAGLPAPLPLPCVVGGALGLCSAIGNIVSDGDGNSDGAQLRRMRRTPVEEPYADPRAATSTAPPDTKPAA